MKEHLGNRTKFYGVPDSGDSTYSRLTILLSPTRNGFSTKLAGLDKANKPDTPEDWFRQKVAVTRSTDSRGRVLSATPQKMDKWVPRLWSQTHDQWLTEVFKVAIKDR